MLLHRFCWSIASERVSLLSLFTLTTQTATPFAHDDSDSFVVTVRQEIMWDYDPLTVTFQ